MNEMHDSYNEQPIQWHIIPDAKIALYNLLHVCHFLNDGFPDMANQQANMKKDDCLL